jgi:hypothetical protein
MPGKRKLQVDWSNRKAPGSKGYRASKKRPGTVPKGSTLTKSTVSFMTQKEKRIAKEERARQNKEYRATLQAEEQLKVLKLKEAEIKQKLSEKLGKVDVQAELNVEEKSLATVMLNDMRWVYKQINGRKRLKDMVDTDDKQFAFLVKELIKFEVAEAEKGRGIGGEGGQGMAAFVVIRGLNDEITLGAMMGDQKNVISNQRIAITMTNPDGSDVEKVERKDEVIDVAEPKPVITPEPTGVLPVKDEEDFW